MATSALTAPHANRITHVAPVSLRGLIAAEFIALRSLRATHITGIVALVGTAAFAALMAMVRMTIAAEVSGAGSFAAGAVINGSIVATVCAIMLGASNFGKEQSSGALTTLLAVAPRRASLLTAKALVLFAVVTVAGFLVNVVAMGAAAVTEYAFGLRAVPAEPLFGILPMFGLAVTYGLTAVIAMSTAALLRSDRWASTILLTLFLVAPTILLAVPVEWVNAIGNLLFSVGQGALYAPNPDAAVLARDIAVTVAWPVITFAGALMVFRRRDA